MSTIRETIRDGVADGGAGRRILHSHIVKKGVRMGISAIAFVILWQVIATVYFSPATLPTPTLVATELAEILEDGGPRGYTAWYHLQRSLVRVLISAAIGMSLAVVLGLLMGVNDHVEDALSLWLPFWMTIPSVVVVLISMIIFRFSDMAVIVAVVFAATPYATVNIWKGVQTVDGGLLEMTDAFNFGAVDVWRHVYLPAILPSIFGSLRYLVSMVWKIVVLAEVFGINSGMGAMFRFWYGQGSVVTLLAYLTLFVGVMFVIEYVVLYPLERHLFRWRDD